MGMYTELKYKVKLKTEFAEVMKVVLSIQEVGGLDSFDIMSDGHEFFSDQRAVMMFCGANCSHKLVDGILIGEADIKNYTDTYDKYLDLLERISENIVLFKIRYEEYDEDEDGWTYKYGSGELNLLS